MFVSFKSIPKELTMLNLTKNFLFVLVMLPAFVSGQLKAPTADTLAPQVIWQQKDSLIQFQSNLRPLRQIAGAPEAFYSYFWEFGDGHFSFEEQPKHVYRDSGQYTVRLFATNNYDDGKAPPTRPRPIKVKSGSAIASNHNQSGFFTENNELQLKVNQMPRPGEDMVCIIGYQNPEGKETPVSGSLVLFFNDTKFKNKNFGLTDLRKYHGESTSDLATLLASRQTDEMIHFYAISDVPSFGPSQHLTTTGIPSSAAGLLQQKQQLFSDQNTLHFTGLKAGEMRYVYAVLHTTPEMIKDTNATVTLTAMLIPDDPSADVVESNLELQIVASHDPNKMMLNNRRLNYRLMGKNKELKYKVRFQNTGKGPASTIDVGVSIPPAFDPATISINDMYPKCIPCAEAEPGQSCLDTIITSDSVHFVFKNIYLPGVRQEGVKDKDSTKGFVEYRIRFKEKPAKLPFWSQAGIVFDTNEPIYTNKMHTRFYRGISPAIIAGYQRGFGDDPDGNSPFIVGAALAPYSPYRAFLQVEAYLGIYQQSKVTDFALLPRPIDTVYNNMEHLIIGEGTVTERNLLSLDIVPLEIRKNINNWFSVGGGLWLKGNLYERTTVAQQTRLVSQLDKSEVDLFKDAGSEKKSFTHINPAAFVDINLGRVRVGPAVGVRLLQFFSPNKTGLMMYGIWKL